MLDPIPTTDLSSTDVDRITIETRDKMLTVLEQISPKAANGKSAAVNGDASVKKEL